MMRQSDSLHKKRFGQYFSGKKVADMLLSLLPETAHWKNVIDPMAGTGDMLVSVKNKLNICPELLGIEIDAEIARTCQERVPNASVLCGDAFRNTDILTEERFDLVITNPPYVRYQLLKEPTDVMPSAQEVRKNLICQINSMPCIPETERTFFLNIAKNYSGLSDMAVPSWILCALLTRIGGYIAIVVPDAWLNRDYASPIQYLLLKIFQIEAIARDTNARWFPDAEVKTNLVVARRIKMRKLRDGVLSTTRILEDDKEYIRPTIAIFPHIKGIESTKKWIAKADRAFFSKSTDIPYEISEILGENNSVAFISLSDMGIKCGQGLRTGANDFFYVKVERKEKESLIVKNKSWDSSGKDYRFSKADVLPALQNRGEITGIIVTADKLRTAVIYPRQDIHGDLTMYIASAEHYRDAKGRHFKDFSAVSPNEKKDGNEVIREWFRLPTMARRHLPDLCISRVSAEVPECLYVRQSKTAPIAIDANMVTVWGETSRTVYAALAILNSTWSKLSLELICTVMGGGALKIEATHLKKLRIPKLADDQIAQLESTGLALIKKGKMTSTIQRTIDGIIAYALDDEKATDKMRSLLMYKYKERRTK